MARFSEAAAVVWWCFQLLSFDHRRFFSRIITCTRTITPFSDITVPEYVRHRVEENTLDSLQEAVRLSPTNGLAFARLAGKVLEQDTKDNPRKVGEADFYSRHALKLAPNDSEISRIRTEILERIAKEQKP